MQVIRSGWRPGKDGELPVVVGNGSVSSVGGRHVVGVNGCGDAPLASGGRPVPPNLPSGCDRGGVGPASAFRRGAPAVSPVLPLSPVAGVCGFAPPRPPPPAGPGGVVTAGAPSFGGGVVSPDIIVAHKRSRLVHIRAVDSETTACAAWGCGTLLSPSPFALCSSIPENWKKCRICWRWI